MRIKWIGLTLLILNLFLIQLYNSAGVIGHALAFMVVAICVVIIFADCRKNDVEYMKRQEELK